jgi:hypothetical protein
MDIMCAFGSKVDAFKMKNKNDIIKPLYYKTNERILKLKN